MYVTLARIRGPLGPDIQKYFQFFQKYFQFFQKYFQFFQKYFQFFKNISNFFKNIYKFFSKIFPFFEKIFQIFQKYFKFFKNISRLFFKHDLLIPGQNKSARSALEILVINICVCVLKTDPRSSEQLCSKLIWLQ